jgi:hypothetical protein
MQVNGRSYRMGQDVEEVFKQAVAAGAKITMPVADMFWGDRYGLLEDPFGHHWSVATHVRDVNPKGTTGSGTKCLQIEVRISGFYSFNGRGACVTSMDLYCLCRNGI